MLRSGRTATALACAILTAPISLQMSSRRYFACAEKPLTSKIGYVCDVEGNLSYWERYKFMSHVLEQAPEQKLRLKDGCQFVYGGDVMDRGSGDLRVLRELMELKRTYPDRVHFIIGNRDLNKLRFFTELQPEILAEPPQVYWIKDKTDGKDTVNNLVERVKWILRRTMGSPDAFEHRKRELKELKLPYTDEDVAKTFYELVCPAVKRSNTEGPISYGDTDSKWVLPQEMRGLLVEYLKAGHLGLILGDTLFVHGSYREGNAKPHFGMTLFHRAKYGRDGVSFFEGLKSYILDRSEGDIQSQLDELNRVKDLELDDYDLQRQLLLLKARKHTWAAHGYYDDAQDGSRLLQYGMGWLNDGSVNKTLIYNNYSYKDTQSGEQIMRAPSRSVVEELKKSNIHRVVVGHQPNGDCPTVLPSKPKAPGAKVDMEVVMGDTSYSANVQMIGEVSGKPIGKGLLKNSYGGQLPQVAPGSTRGLSVSEVLIHMDERPSARSSTCILHGILEDGQVYECRTPLSCSAEDPCAHLGQRMEGGWVPKVYVSGDRRSRYGNSVGGGVYLLTHYKGWELSNKYMDEEKVIKALQSPGNENIKHSSSAGL